MARTFGTCEGDIRDRMVENKQRRWRGYRRVGSSESGNDPAVVVRDSTLTGLTVNFIFEEKR